ncbi:exported hypothetical protein [Candidatus Zixiibacteriota bacterium]|nr:exported hypothetical protein [candidate division Zixibacteria bacterium]
MQRNGCFLLLITVVCLFWVSASIAADRRIDTTKLKIMTYNAEFLFDGLDPEGQADFPWKNSPDEARTHMASIAEIIKAANADIVNLVEVEDLSVLDTLNSVFLSGYGYMPYLVKGTDTYTRENVGLLTRIDPIEGAVHRSEEKGTSGSVMKSVSKHYYTTIQVNGRDITLIGIHLLAIPGNESRKLQREAQADAIRKLAVAQTPQGGEIIIMGDCNDYDPDCFDMASDMPITTVLSQLKEMDQGTSSDNLVSVICAKQYPQNLRYTSWWDKNNNGVAEPGEYSSIDHVLISPELATYLAFVDINHSYDPAKVSDHFPVVAEFNFSQGPDTLPPASAILYIAKVLPNPDGDERQNEAIWLINKGNSDISLRGWKIQDKANTIWDLNNDGKVKAGETKEIQRNGRPMSINNTGDVLQLVDNSGKVVSVVAFGQADPEEVLEFAP